MTAVSVTPTKRLGQHFLTSPRVIARIVDAIAPQPRQTIAEIGPGTGALTRELLSRGAAVLAVETDDRCYPALAELSAEFDNRLTVIGGDALQLDTWLPHLPEGSKVVGNLPYNVGTEIVAALLHQGPRIGEMTFMLQKEVVQRLTAKPGGKTWGRLGVLTHLLCEPTKLFDVAPGNFNPPPKVVSSMVRLTPLAAPRYAVNLAKLDILLRTAFGQRRKMLRASLKPLLSEEQIAAAGIAPTARPESLTTEQLCNLANLL